MNLAPLARVVLWPLSLLYGAIVRFRLWLYRKGLRTTNRLNTPVISVGNLTLGGTGKTPMVIWLAERFLTQGKRVGILTRGYKGSSGSSDEIELMSERLQNRVSFGVGADRFSEGRKLEQQGIDIFLLDDGFQHLPLARDVNLLLLDAARPLGRERLLPAGRLREPISSMSRADLLVFTRTETNPGTDSAIEQLTDYPVFAAKTRLLGFRRLGSPNSDELLPPNALGSGPFYAFCGIGNPGAFLIDLEHWSLEISGKRAFADHHRYTQLEADELLDSAAESGAHAFVTTEKDAHNLRDTNFGDTPVYIAIIEFELAQESAFFAAIEQKLAARQPQQVRA